MSKTETHGKSINKRKCTEDIREDTTADVTSRLVRLQASIDALHQLLTDALCDEDSTEQEEAPLDLLDP